MFLHLITVLYARITVFSCKTNYGPLHVYTVQSRKCDHVCVLQCTTVFGVSMLSLVQETTVLYWVDCILWPFTQRIRSFLSAGCYLGDN